MSDTKAVFDQRALIASLSDSQRQHLQKRSDREGLKRLFGHFGLLLFGSIWIIQGWTFWQLVLLPQGILLVFLFTAQHEATHETAFASSWINRWVARFCGLLLLVPPLWFRYFHFAHHRHTQNPDKDPELEGAKPESIFDYLKHISGVPLWYAMAKVIVGHAFGGELGAYVPQKAHERVRQEARLLLTFYCVLISISFFAGSALLFWVWIVPALLGQPFLRLYLLAEHGRCPMVANMLENSRTTFTNSAIRFLAWNMPYHAEHHAMPTVPFHQLPALHQHTANHLKSVSNGYVEFHKEYARSMRS